MTTIIRRAVYADGPPLYRAWQALRRHNSDVEPRIVPTVVSEPEFMAGWGDRLSRTSSAVFVADEGGDVVAFISGGIVPNQPDRLPEMVANVGYLYVEPEYRRRGLARELFEAMAGWAANQDGVSHLEMAVLAADDPATLFWRAVGFTPFIERLWAPIPGAGRD